MARRSARLDGGLALEDAVAAGLKAARARHFKAAVAEHGVKFNPFSPKPVAARIGVCRTTLYFWESGRFRPQSLDFYHRWARAVGADFAITIDGGGIDPERTAT